MNATEIKSWASEVIDRVKSRRPVEDSRVECKALWLDPKSIARQFAGHANSAKGESILWLIGVDEKAQAVTGVDRNELANWYPQLVKEFDGVAPCLVGDLNIDIDNRTVVALLFETASAPFLVKVPGGDRLEIPWRQGTRTRSATRTEVLRIFAVLQSQGALTAVDTLINESPRAQNLAIERPHCWEYLLTLELLKPKLAQVSRTYKEVSAGLVHTRTRMVSGKDFSKLIREKMSDIVSWTQVLKAWAGNDLVAAWGAPGEPGDPVEIKRAVNKFISAANELVEWERDILSSRPPEIFTNVKSSVRGVTSQLFEEMERFVKLLGEPFEQGLPPSGTVVNINLVLDFPQDKIAQIEAETDRICRLINDDPERFSALWDEV